MTVDSKVGSPPQVRGKLVHAVRSIAIAGITPAGAGKTYYTYAVNEKSWDHPRRCGENVVRNVACEYRKGSPPQVRGKLSADM